MKSLAAKLFRMFHCREARAGELVSVAITGSHDALLVGKIPSIRYIAAGDGKLYEHKFKVSDRPLLFVSADGSQVYVTRGSYRFTARGFIG